MPEIEIENVETDSNVLRSEVSCSPELRRFFSGEDLRTQYSVDIDDVPEPILTIPVLAQVWPVACMTGAEVAVPELDSAFRDALEDVQHALKRMYPELIRGGASLVYGELTGRDVAPEFDGHGLLFTGGVDSTFSYVRHRHEEPALINVGGWTVRRDENETWDDVKRYLDSFAADHGLDALYVRSNMLSFLRNAMLIAHSEPHVAGAWYSSVGHGLGLPGLCAPLAHATGIGNLYMSAAHWEDDPRPWGSNPDVVDNVRWSTAQAHLEGFEYTRQERLEFVAEYVKSEESDLTLVTCSEEVSGNCGRCEKCCRTAVGLLLAGLDPNEHGYDFNSRTFSYVRDRVENGDWRLRDAVPEWKDLQDHAVGADGSFDGSDEFFKWLREADWEDYVNRERRSVESRYIYPAYRNIPYRLFNVLDSYLEIGPFGTY